MTKTWILIANASVAFLYEPEWVNSKPTLKLVGEYSHPDSRKKDRQITSDREGQYIARTGGHGNFIEASDPHQYEAEVFARELFQVIEQGRVNNKYQSLTLIAAPHFMGLLRQCIDERPLKNVDITEIQKDYTKEKPHDLVKILNLKKPK